MRTGQFSKEKLEVEEDFSQDGFVVREIMMRLRVDKSEVIWKKKGLVTNDSFKKISFFLRGFIHVGRGGKRACIFKATPDRVLQ